MSSLQFVATCEYRAEVAWVHRAAGDNCRLSCAYMHMCVCMYICMYVWVVQKYTLFLQIYVYLRQSGRAIAKVCSLICSPFATKQCKHIRTHFYVCVCVCVYKKIVVATLWPAVFTTALRLLCLLVVVVFLQKWSVAAHMRRKVHTT